MIKLSTKKIKEITSIVDEIKKFDNYSNFVYDIESFNKQYGNCEKNYYLPNEWIKKMCELTDKYRSLLDKIKEYYQNRIIKAMEWEESFPHFSKKINCIYDYLDVCITENVKIDIREHTNSRFPLYVITDIKKITDLDKKFMYKTISWDITECDNDIDNPPPLLDLEGVKVKFGRADVKKF